MEQTLKIRQAKTLSEPGAIRSHQPLDGFAKLDLVKILSVIYISLLHI